MSIIQVKNLSKDFDYYEKEIGLKNSIKNIFSRKKLVKRAVNDITFEIEEGEFIGFLGPNGAGKTTTLKMLSGILYPSEGSALVNGLVPWKREKKFKMGIALVMGQKSGLNWDLPANESLYLNKCIYEISDENYRNNLGELVEIFDVKDILNVQVRRLSLGERMKMELIAALLHRPKIMFLDEPTIGLDVISQAKIRQFLKHYNEYTKTTIILTSHYVNDIDALCKRTIVINEGQIVYNGNLGEIRHMFAQNKIISMQFSDIVSKEDISRFGKIKEYDGFHMVLEVPREQAKEFSREITGTFPIVDFNIEDMPIEDAIADLYRLGVK